MNLNTNQILAILSAILSVLVVSTAQLTDLFGVGTAKTIVSMAALVNSILSSVLAVVSSQGQQVRNVLAMPGVDKLTVNSDANQTLSQIAIDPQQTKIAPTLASASAVAATAKGA